MSRLFSSLRRGSSATPTAAIVDEKDHGDDDDDIELGAASSLSSSSLSIPTASTTTSLLLPPDHSTTPPPSESSSFGLRIKFNNGKCTTDYKLCNIPNDANSMTVGMLKARILSEYDRRCVMARTSTNSSTDSNNEGGTTVTTASNNNNDHHCNNNHDDERYLRLIIRGRMMAPDRNTLASFCIVNDDVIHAVLTTIIQPTNGGRRGGISGSGSSITRRGQQARMLHRMNSNSNSNTSGRVGEGGGIPSLWRRTGIDYNGIVVPSRDMTNSNNNTDDDDSTSSSEDDDDEEYNDIAVAGEIEGNDCNGGRSSRRRRPRERRGFDRLRAVSLYIFFYGGGRKVHLSFQTCYLLCF